VLKGERAMTPVAGIDLSSPQFWGQGPDAKHAAFAQLRAEERLRFFDEGDYFVDPRRKGDGYWAVTRYEEILELSKLPEGFSSAQGIGIGDVDEVTRELFGSMIVMDDPRHARMRKLVAAGFTPRMLKKLEGIVQQVAAEIVDEVGPRGECDFVTDIAAALPLQIICDLMGIPRSEYRFVFDRTNVILGAADPEYVDPGADRRLTVLDAAQDLADVMTGLSADRRGNSDHDDLTAALVNAEVDGERLTQQELASFFVLLVAAGNETTRNAISHGMWLLHNHPDQRAIWAADFEGVAPTAVDEIVRLASPVIFMRRTATHATTVRGTEIAAGDKLLLFYAAANRDEAAFPDADRFDVRRTPNFHVGFGGPGPHFCLGAHLARREMTVMFRELFERLPDLQITGQPQYLLSNFIHGIKHMPCRYTPTG
jgi:cytochrome P450